jgi:hypothetical protein
LIVLHWMIAFFSIVPCFEVFASIT